MVVKLHHLLLIFLLLPTTLPAQSPDHVWLDNGTIRVRINADGRLFCDDEKGAFLVPHGDSMVSIMRGAGLWFGGFDLGGNLKLAIQTPDPGMSDFSAGFIDVPNSGKIWKVTRKEIIAHIEDYQDNFQIDNPIPSIFAWPGPSNPFFEQYNGFKQGQKPYAGVRTSLFYRLDTLPVYTAYRPDLGDYPFNYALRLRNLFLVPLEMAFFTFYTDRPLSFTSTGINPVQVWGYAAVFDCNINNLISNTVFVNWNWRRTVEEEWIDSMFTSVYTDIDLGDPIDDYHGSSPKGDTYFVYNADSLDEIYGLNPPICYISVLENPYQNDENAAFPPAPMKLMPFGCGKPCDLPGIPSGRRYPESSGEYYNYMTSTWRDGTPLTEPGNGYNPGEPTAPQAPGAFRAYPEGNGEWSELNEGNLNNNRLGLLNFDTRRLSWDLYNELTLAYSIQPRSKPTLKEDILEYEKFFDKIRFPDYVFNMDSLDIFAEMECIKYVPLYETPQPLIAFPNPVSDVLKIWNRRLALNEMILYDQFGRKVAININAGDYSEIYVSDLPAGMYFLTIKSIEGVQDIIKIIVAH